jgi:hypothetical protein
LKSLFRLTLLSVLVYWHWIAGKNMALISREELAFVVLRVVAAYIVVAGVSLRDLRINHFQS